MGADFRRLYCQKYELASEQFEQKLFWHSLFRHSLPVVAVLARWQPDLFREDFDLMRELATSRSRGEVIGELNRFYGRNRRVGGFWRNMLLCRVSGKRVLQIYRSLANEFEETLVHSPA